MSDPVPEPGAAFGLVSTAFGLKPKQQALILKVLWVIAVSGHIMLVCNVLERLGMPTPFAYAEDVADLRRASNMAAQLSIAAELRAQYQAWCKADYPTRSTLENSIEKLQVEYARYAHERYPQPMCAP
jgi:hypothetical protein